MAIIKTIFTNIANAIRTKKGTSDKYLPENMASEVLSIETGITPSGKIEITNTEEINVTNYATAQVVDSNLSAENIKKDITILGVTGTFKGGGDTSIEDGLVSGELSGDYSNDRINIIKKYAFVGCNKITSVSLPNVTSIGDSAFQNCEKLTNISIPNLEIVGNGVFRGCKFTSVSFPNIKNLNDNTFYECSVLVNISIPNVTKIGLYAFYFCKSIIRLYIPNVTYINSWAFAYCKALIKLIITQTDSVCTLKNTNAFTSCYHFLGTTDSTYNPQGLKDGRIYVPDSLVDSYKSATNWSVYADCIVPLSTLEE